MMRRPGQWVGVARLAARTTAVSALRCGGLAAALAAWVLLALGQGGLDLPVLCAGRLLGQLPDGAELAWALSWLSPVRLGAGWALMLVAMMAPLLAAPLAHLRARSLRRDRRCAMGGFLVGYFGVWMAIGVPVLALALGLRLTGAASLPGMLPGLLAVLVWQVLPGRQRALNRCHTRPPLSACGTTPGRAGLVFGLRQGLWCAVTCAPLMLLALLLSAWAEEQTGQTGQSGHSLTVMVVLALWIWAERTEPARPPRFGLRLPRQAVRLLRHRLGLMLA